MHVTSALHSLAWLTAAVAASPLHPRQGVTANGTNVVSALWDGTCFYPKSVSTFDLASYLGTWYQVAGYEAIFTAGCKCITADYSLNDDGTVGVKNQCEAVGLPITITGSAAPVDPIYGDAGAFEVTFFNATNACPGPNYIVQEYVVDDYAIVQSPDFGTLFVLSREQNVTETKLDALITRAVELGSKRSLIKVNDQSACLHT
ncbi:lipocalin-like domain-containing protein [Diaporthe eres]|uniref:Lipocalin/cytosolic fatty-acid binding domain-containing protein n=1 Tax=Diaporthe vaccinii TaxID=105482 RepID=A0ABR4EEG4_9PEZI|nr:lipocalin-like domain-containing protein [Diaporthe eres]